MFRQMFVANGIAHRPIGNIRKESVNSLNAFVVIFEIRKDKGVKDVFFVLLMWEVI